MVKAFLNMFLQHLILELSEQLTPNYKLFQNHFRLIGVPFDIFDMTHRDSLRWTKFGLDAGFSHKLAQCNIKKRKFLLLHNCVLPNFSVKP